MASTNNSRSIIVKEKMKVTKLKVKVGTMVYEGRILLVYESCTEDQSDLPKQKKMLKSTETGIIQSINIKEGDTISPGSEIIELAKAGCNHPTVIKDLCAECGADLQRECSENETTASVSMIHMVPELKVNDELAQILGRADIERLLSEKKLVLLVDLDQTLIHTTNDNVPNNIKDVYHFQLYGSVSPWYHTRLRPGTHKFLEKISEKFELHICTFGSRRYAHMIAGFLDSDRKFFSHRILSRDECFNANSKTANLKALFPCGEDMVCIIDDREDVWDFAPNLIHVKPYHFFQHTGDIHAPPGLSKCENDEEDGFDFSELNTLGETENANNDQSETNTNSEKGKSQSTELDVFINIDNTDSEVVASVTELQKLTTNDEISNKLVEDVKNEENESTSVENVTNNDEISENLVQDKNNKAYGDNFSEEKTITSCLSKAVDQSNQSVTTENESKINLAESFTVNEISKRSSNRKSKERKESLGNVTKLDADGNIIIEESDDYLLYLEEILNTVHSKFFDVYEKTEQMPDLKAIVPEIRNQILKGISICFSGIVPNRMKLEKSPAYKAARSLGANVTQNIEDDTTHLVAVRSGTVKVRSVSKRKNIKLVTPQWLWTCAERWEKVDERLFPLENANSSEESRHPPAHCRSPEHIFDQAPVITPNLSSAPAESTVQSKNSSGFLYSIHPLMSLSSADIKSMEGEVDDIFNESDTELDDSLSVSPNRSEKPSFAVPTKRKLNDSEESSSSSNHPANDGSETMREKRQKNEVIHVEDVNLNGDDNLDNALISNDEYEEGQCEDIEDCRNSDCETINEKFRRGAELPSDIDMEVNSDDEEDQDPDCEWDMMGEALEREFLDG